MCSYLNSFLLFYISCFETLSSIFFILALKIEHFCCALKIVFWLMFFFYLIPIQMIFLSLFSLMFFIWFFNFTPKLADFCWFFSRFVLLSFAVLPFFQIGFFEKNEVQWKIRFFMKNTSLKTQKYLLNFIFRKSNIFRKMNFDAEVNAILAKDADHKVQLEAWVNFCFEKDSKLKIAYKFKKKIDISKLIFSLIGLLYRFLPSPYVSDKVDLASTLQLTEKGICLSDI